MLVIVSRSLAGSLLLRLCLAHSDLLSLSLLLDVLDKLRDGHAVFLGIDGQLPLHRLDLLGSRALTSWHSHSDLAWTRHLAGLRWRSGHFDRKVRKECREGLKLEDEEE